MTWPVSSYTVAENTNHPTEPGTGSQELAESSVVSREARARRALENLAELEPDLKAAAVIDADGQAVASTGKAANWNRTASELLAALDGAGGKPVDSAHLATGEGEIFVVREGGLALIAVTARFVLASLTSFDLRMALRDLSKGAESA